MVEIGGSAAVATFVLNAGEKIVTLITSIIDKCEEQKNMKLIQQSYLVKATRIRDRLSKLFGSGRDMPEVGIQFEDLKHTIDYIAQCLESMEPAKKKKPMWITSQKVKQEYITVLQILFTEADNELYKIEKKMTKTGIGRPIVVGGHAGSTGICPTTVTHLIVNAKEDALIVKWKVAKKPEDEKLKYQVELRYLSRCHLHDVEPGEPREDYYSATFYELATWTNYIVRVRGVCESGHRGEFCPHESCFFRGKPATPAKPDMIESPDQYKIKLQFKYRGLRTGEELTRFKLLGYNRSNREQIRILHEDIKRNVREESIEMNLNTESRTQTLSLTVDFKDYSKFVCEYSFQIFVHNSLYWSDPSDEFTICTTKLKPMNIIPKYDRNKDSIRFYWNTPTNYGVVHHYNLIIHGTKKQRVINIGREKTEITFRKNTKLIKEERYTAELIVVTMERNLNHAKFEFTFTDDGDWDIDDIRSLVLQN